MAITDDIERLVKMFEDVEKYILDMCAGIVSTNPLAHSLVLWKRRAQLVHAELMDLRKQLLKVTPDVVNASYRAGFKAVTRDNPFGTSVNTRAIALLAAGMNDKLDASLATVGRRVNDSFRQAGLRASAYHAAAGTDKRVAALAMQHQLERDGTRAFIDKAGRKWGLRSYTTMVIVTTTREAMSQGSYGGLKETGHELIKISHHASSCKICLPFDGKTFRMPGVTNPALAAYPILESLPPFHPYCKHSVGPANATFDTLMADLEAQYGQYV